MSSGGGNIALKNFEKIDLSQVTLESGVDKVFTFSLDHNNTSGVKEINCDGINSNIYADGTSDDNYVSGDSHTASGGDMTIIGGNGSDIIRGGQKVDTIYAGTKEDTDTGSALTDRYLLKAEGNSGWVEDEAFADVLHGESGAGVNGKFVNYINGWLGDDLLYGSTGADAFEYHTHTGSNVRYAADKFSALGADTIHNFELGKDMLFINMIELASGGNGHGIKATTESKFADILYTGNIKEDNISVSGGASAADVVKVEVTAMAGQVNNDDYTVKFFIGSTDTLTIDLVDVTSGGSAYSYADNVTVDVAKIIVTGLLAGNDWLADNSAI